MLYLRDNTRAGMFRKNTHSLVTEAAGLVFSNPLGMPYALRKRRFACFHRAPSTGFLVMTPPASGSVLPWVKGLKTALPEGSVVAVDIHTDIVRTFSLVYDFADFIIVDPDSDSGIGATDLADIVALVDELVSLRLCYEHYTPVFLRLTHGITHDEIQALLDTCRLSGLDGVVVPTLPMLAQVREITLGRVPVICMVQNPEDGLKALQNGASLLEARPGFKGVKKLLKILETQ